MYDPKKADMWSMGCVLYIMSTGLMVFDDENVKKTIKKQEQKCIFYPKNVPVNLSIKNIIGLVNLF